LLGFLIGAGAILPGISSGVFCVVLGLYEKLVDSILHFFKNIKENIRFLFPILIGVFAGVFILGNVLKIVYDKFYVVTCFCFMGLILGSLKLVYKQANITKISFSHVLILLLTFSFSLYLIFLESSYILNTVSFSNSYLILCGVLMSAGIVVPGISKTVILMLLGIYEMYLSAITSLNITFLAPLGLGLIIGGLIFLVIMQFLFNNFKSYTYFAIIGFVLSSIFVIYPGFSFDTTGVLAIIIFVVSFVISYICSAKSN